jgi:hypothetical protein
MELLTSLKSMPDRQVGWIFRKIGDEGALSNTCYPHDCDDNISWPAIWC